MSYPYAMLGEVLVNLLKREVTDIDKRATRIQEYVDHANSDGGYEYDRYLENGGVVHPSIVTANSGETRECINWDAHHYLGLNRNANVINRAGEAMREYGTGSGASAAYCGMSALHKQLEERVARMVGKEKAVLFPTGYAANTGAIAQLAGEKDLIIFDRECHASIIDGLKLSSAKWVSFKHNNIVSLAAKLAQHQDSYENIFIVLESVYSMSGDLAPLKDIAELKECYRFFLYVDETHTFGLYGDRGQGYCQAEGISDQVDFIMSSLSTATASFGGFVAAKERYCSLLKCSDSYVFQPCIPAADAAAALAALDEIEAHPELIEDLHEKARYMRDRLRGRGFAVGQSQSPIIAILIEDDRKLNYVVSELFAEGIISMPICFPTVKAHEARIRLAINAIHTCDDIIATVEALERLCNKYEVLFKDKGTDAESEIDFASLLDRTTAQSNKSGEMLTMAFMHLTNIDAINKKFPPETVEHVFDRLSKLIKNTLRADDRVGRYETDKLGIVLRDIDPPDASGLCRRLIAKADEYDWNRVAPGLSVETSIHILEVSGQELAG